MGNQTQEGEVDARWLAGLLDAHASKRYKSSFVYQYTTVQLTPSRKEFAWVRCWMELWGCELRIWKAPNSNTNATVNNQLGQNIADLVKSETRPKGFVIEQVRQGRDRGIVNTNMRTLVTVLK